MQLDVVRTRNLFSACGTGAVSQACGCQIQVSPRHQWDRVGQGHGVSSKLGWAATSEVAGTMPCSAFRPRNRSCCFPLSNSCMLVGEFFKFNEWDQNCTSMFFTSLAAPTSRFFRVLYFCALIEFTFQPHQLTQRSHSLWRLDLACQVASQDYDRHKLMKFSGLGEKVCFLHAPGSLL